MKNDIMFALFISALYCVVFMLYSVFALTVNCGIILAGFTGVMILGNIKNIYYCDIWEET